MNLLKNIFSLFGTSSASNKSKRRRTRHHKRFNKKYTRRVRKMRGG